MPDPLHLHPHPVDEPRGAVLVVHGFGEHSGRYRHVQERLAADGWASLAFDLRGHGASPGRRTYIARFEEYLDDVDEGLAALRERWPELPLVLLGHSLGGLIAARWIQERGAGGVDALVLSAPAFSFAVPLPWHQRLLAQVASRVSPTLRRESRVNILLLSHDPRNALAIMQDRLCEPTATARWFTESQRAQRQALAAAGEVGLPLCLLVAGDDTIVGPDAARAFFAAAGSADKQLFDYPELYHELFNETERERVFGDLVGWLAHRFPAREPDPDAATAGS
ncbi:MAG: lysophospholipase [Planctomycetota bacterium]